MPSYKLTQAAEADLREIAQYTIREWGEQQALLYASTLAQTFQSIAKGQALSRPFSERMPQVLVTQCEQHYVFHLHQKEKIPCIIAVLHKRMDLLTRLLDRFPE